jgi:hypothetical protein
LGFRWTKEVIRTPRRDDVNVRSDAPNAGDGGRRRRNREVWTTERLLVLYFVFMNVISGVDLAEKNVDTHAGNATRRFSLGPKGRDPWSRRVDV